MFSLKSLNLFTYFILLSFCIWELILGINSNSLGLLFIALTLYLNIICVLCSIKTIKYNTNIFLILLFFQSLILIGVFLTKNILVFYILFEASLIPIFILVIGWGSREEKLRAGYYLFFFTLISSLLMLLSIVKIYILTGTLNVNILSQIYLPLDIQKWCMVCFSLAMAVKMPMFPFHIWLPQAHVEAPLAGSVFLAGILLKLGGYGFIYFVLPLFSSAFFYFSPFLQWASILGVVYGGLTTIRQSDMKRLIAYSSVAHMGFSTFALFNVESEMGILSCILILIAHGFVSPALFLIVGFIYERFGTRIIKYYKGLGVNMPILDSFAFLFTLCSIAFPGSLNFIGEVIVIFSAVQINILFSILLSIGAFIGLKYSLYFYERVFKGEYSSYQINGKDIEKIEFMCLISLFIPVLILGLFPNIILNLI